MEKQINDKFVDSYAFYAHRILLGVCLLDSEVLLISKGTIMVWGLPFIKHKNHRMQLRFSLADQKDHRQRFKNLNGSSGENTLDQDELFFNTSLSFLDELKWNFGLLRMGLRYDYQRLSTQRERDEVRLNSLNPSLGFTYTKLETM